VAVKITPSSGNVYRDLGFPRAEAENLLIRTDLMIRIEKLIRGRGLTQAGAARLFGVSQPRISDLVRGKIQRFSIDSLVEMLGLAGARVRLTVRLPQGAMGCPPRVQRALKQAAARTPRGRT
jgi:predicted XRE-type DNA-binding protein